MSATVYQVVQVSSKGDDKLMVSKQKKLTNSYYWLRKFIPSIVFLLLIITSCSVDVGTSNSATPAPQIYNPPFRSLIDLDLEADTEPLYKLGHTAAVAFADKIDELATRVNSAGMVIFACRISSNSWNDCPVSFKTPAIEKWVLPPPDPATHCSPDPFQCSKQKREYKKAYADWQVIHANQVNTLAKVSARVHTQTNKIRTMKFQWDANGSDIFGALATGANNLQGLNAPYKYLLLATDFISTTSQQGSLSLAGCRVVSVFRTSSDNAFSQQSNSYWSNVARSAGAISFTSYSVPQSQALGIELPE